MANIEDWTEKNEDMIVFHFANEQANILQELIKIGPANRITTEFQSIAILKGRAINDRLPIRTLKILCDRVEDYQAGTGLPHNTKEMLLEAIEFERFLALQRSRYAGLTEVGQGQVQNK
jgi:hypothetical protein